MKERKFSRVYTGKEYDLLVDCLDRFEAAIEPITPDSEEARMLAVWLDVRKNNDKRMLSFSLYNTFLLARLGMLREPIRCVNILDNNLELFNQVINSARMLMIKHKKVPAEFID